MPAEYSEAQKRLMKAAFELGQAQRVMEDAHNKFQAALRNVENLEDLALPTDGEVRGILTE